jgi:RES domain-containing protein
VPRQLSCAWTHLPPVTDALDPQKLLLRRGTETTSEIGKQWLVQANELAIRVPSIVIPEEDNILLNPNAPGYDSLIWDTKPFDWDGRLLNLLTQSGPS